jgi:sulfur relay (sulfurtransferase) complex TusBCD TusD component (DsrE family)
MKLAFVVLTEFLKFQPIYSLMNLISAAKAKGHDILGIFFFGSGVLNIHAGSHLGKSTRDIPTELASLGVPLIACQTWADNYGIFKENAIEGADITGLGELSNITDEADKVILFGAHA